MRLTAACTTKFESIERKLWLTWYIKALLGGHALRGDGGFPLRSWVFLPYTRSIRTTPTYEPTDCSNDDAYNSVPKMYAVPSRMRRWWRAWRRRC